MMVVKDGMVMTSYAVIEKLRYLSWYESKSAHG